MMLGLCVEYLCIAAIYSWEDRRQGLAIVAPTLFDIKIGIDERSHLM